MNSLANFTKYMRWIHIYSAIPVLTLMIFFAITGLLLNHPDWHLGGSKQDQQFHDLPAELKQLDWHNQSASSSLQVIAWLDQALGLRPVKLEIEWDELDELLILNYLGPQGATTVELDTQSSTLEVFRYSLATLEMLNNLHRGKHVSRFWRLLSDLSALCMLAFCFTGLWLVLVNRVQRLPSTAWLAVGSLIFFLSIYLMH